MLFDKRIFGVSCTRFLRINALGAVQIVAHNSLSSDPTLIRLFRRGTMDEERVGVGLLDAGQGYGTLSESSASFNPTLNTNLDENGTLNSFNNQPSSEEAREPLVQPSLEPTTMGETPDQILNSFGLFQKTGKCKF